MLLTYTLRITSLLDQQWYKYQYIPNHGKLLSGQAYDSIDREKQHNNASIRNTNKNIKTY